MTSSCGPEVFGADPANIQWSVVRGDTSTLRVEFYENDETTAYNTATWDYAATVPGHKPAGGRAACGGRSRSLEAPFLLLSGC